MERLSPQDLVNLRVEDRGLPMHVAALIIFDGAVRAGLADSGRAGLAGPLDLDTLRVVVAQRLHLVPRLRQVLYRPGPGLGLPVWVDAAGFDIGEHVRARPVPAPGDEAALLRVCTELNQDRLDRSRPLWQMWLLTGLADHRAGLLVRLHHVVADGIAALAMLAALCDPDPGTAAADVPAWAPEAVPSGRELAADQLQRQALAVTGAVRALRHPSAGAARLGVLARQAGQLAADGAAPRTSLNVPVSGHHRLLLVRADLERARAAAHAHGGTVNDLVLTAVAGGARSVLAARGELTPRLVLRASVAASVRVAPDPRATGNQVGILLVPLPVAEADPARRLAQIAAATAARKRQPPVTGPNASRLTLAIAAAQNPGRLLAPRRLTGGLSRALASPRLLIHGRGRVTADLACAIADGSEVISDFRVMTDQKELFGSVASVPTTWRTLDEIAAGGPRALTRVTGAVNGARRQAWAAIEAQHCALPGVRIADRVLQGVTCIRLDATVTPACLDKELAEPDFKGFGHHPLLGYCDNHR